MLLLHPALLAAVPVETPDLLREEIFTMKKRLLFLALSLVAVTAALAPAPADAVKCWTTCCSNGTCFTCCVGSGCPDIACP